MTNTNPNDLSFLAPPGEVCDWRLVLLLDAAARTGIMEALPGNARDLAGRLGLDEHAVSVVLEALAVLGIVDTDGDGGFTTGAGTPGTEARATLNHHARSLNQWAAAIEGQLRGTPPPRGGPPAQPALWLDALAVHARRSAPGSVDACLARFPAAQSVLDLGGGHGEYALEFARRGLKVTMQDRPVMIDIVREQGRLEPAGIGLFAGDFFETLPAASVDLVFCAGVTNTFDGARNSSLYGRLRERITPGGAFVIQTFVRGHHPVAALFGVQMLTVGNGGDAHSEDSYRAWLAEAGYGDVEVLDLEEGRRTLFFAPVNLS